MGIKGLLPYVEEAIRKCELWEFRGKTAAIDASSWLHKAAFGCAEKLVLNQDTNSYVSYCMRFINLLLSCDIKVILVFDGANLPSKKVTNDKRRETRLAAEESGRKFLAAGKNAAARECFQRAVHITFKMVKDVIDACRNLRNANVQCIVSPYEADAQLTYLHLNGYADFVISEDSDLIIFGCEKIFFKLDFNGSGTLFESDKMHLVFEKKKLNFDMAKFRQVCILSGCDYLEAPKGVGLGRATTFFRKVNAADDVRQCLKRLPLVLNMNVTITNEYLDAFIAAEKTFLHQLVYDPKNRCMAPLNPYPDGLNADDMPYAGRLLEDHVATAIACGQLQPNSQAKFNETKSPCSASLTDSFVLKRTPPQDLKPFKTPKKSVSSSAFEVGHIRHVTRTRLSCTYESERSGISEHTAIKRSRFFDGDDMPSEDMDLFQDSEVSDLIDENVSTPMSSSKRSVFDVISSPEAAENVFTASAESTPTVSTRKRPFCSVSQLALSSDGLQSPLSVLESYDRSQNTFVYTSSNQNTQTSESAGKLSQQSLNDLLEEECDITLTTCSETSVDSCSSISTTDVVDLCSEEKEKKSEVFVSLINRSLGQSTCPRVGLRRTSSKASLAGVTVNSPRQTSVLSYLDKFSYNRKSVKSISSAK